MCIFWPSLFLLNSAIISLLCTLASLFVRMKLSSYFYVIPICGIIFVHCEDFPSYECHLKVPFYSFICCPSGMRHRLFCDNFMVLSNHALYMHILYDFFCFDELVLHSKYLWLSRIVHALTFNLGCYFLNSGCLNLLSLLCIISNQLCSRQSDITFALDHNLLERVLYFSIHQWILAYADESIH